MEHVLLFYDTKNRHFPYFSFHPFSVTHHLFLIRVNVTEAVTGRVGGIHSGQASKPFIQGQFGVSNQPNIAAFRGEVMGAKFLNT